MASGPYFDARRGTWGVQWFDGLRWRRVVVVPKRRGWKPGDTSAKKPPPEALAALADYADRERRARQRTGTSIDVTVRDFLDAYLASYASRRPTSREEMRRVAEVFATWCAARKITLLESVTKPIANEWMSDRARTTSKHSGEPLQRATLAKERALLCGAWTDAVRREALDLNPWLSVTVPGKPTVRTRGSWTPEELERLLAVCGPWLRDLVTVGCHTGLRITALRSLEWRDIYWSQGEGGFGFVLVRPENDKAGKGYRVPLDRTCHDVLARRLADRAADLDSVFTGRQGKPIGQSKMTFTAIVRACRRAGLPRPDSPNHHMRRTFGRQAVLGQLTGRPIPLYVVSRWMGHASVKMTERYLDLHQDDSARWMEEATPAAVEPLPSE